MSSKQANLIKEMMKTVPRGIEGRYLHEQQIPQARWIKPEDILASSALNYDPKNPDGKILFGALGDNLIGIKDNRHILTVAGSRAGKSVTVIANEFFYDGSLIAIDPKGEQATITAEARAKLGQKVYIIDPFEVVEGKAIDYRASFNFLANLTLDNRYVIEDTADLVDAIIVSSPNERDPHWNESAGEFLTGVILHVCFSESFENKDRHLGTVREMVMKVLEMTGDESKTPDLQTAMLDTANFLASKEYEEIAIAIAQSTSSFYEKSGTELTSVLSTLRRHIRFLSYPAIKRVIAKHDFNLTDLKTAPEGVSVYIVLPATRMSMCNRLFRMFINKLLADMEREKTKPKQDILMVLDEFPVLGHMKQLQDAAGQIASFSVKLWVILQDWGQGVSLYKDRFESFAANAGIFQAFGNVDNTTTEYISRKLGKTSVLTSTIGETKASDKEQGMTGEKQNLQQFPLLEPDEVSRLFSRSDPLKRQLIMMAGKNPMIIQRVEYWNESGPLQKNVSTLNKVR
jgi:type IV secretion system protein VirD4